MPYLQQFACFNCRKVFKYEVQPTLRQAKTRQDESMRQVDAVVCPDCGQAMWLMGRKFKAPKRNNLKQWQKVEKIRKAGFRRFPKYLWQADGVIEYYNEVFNPPSAGEKLLRKISRKKGDG